MKKWKVFDAPSWSALLSSLARIKETADASSSAVSGLGEDIAELSNLMATGLTGKQDRAKAVYCSIPANGWGKDGTAAYPNYYDLPAVGVTARDRVEIILSPSSLRTAAACGLCQTCESLAGKVRLRSVSVPTAAIVAEYWIEQGKE